eukprot:1161225-Pelagomonas_calceolata.AAC.20
MSCHDALLTGDHTNSSRKWILAKHSKREGGLQATLKLAKPVHACVRACVCTYVRMCVCTLPCMLASSPPIAVQLHLSSTQRKVRLGNLLCSTVALRSPALAQLNVANLSSYLTPPDV